MVVGAISTRKISNEKDLLIYNNKKKKILMLRMKSHNYIEVIYRKLPNHKIAQYNL